MSRGIWSRNSENSLCDLMEGCPEAAEFMCEVLSYQPVAAALLHFLLWRENRSFPLRLKMLPSRFCFPNCQQIFADSHQTRVNLSE